MVSKNKDHLNQMHIATKSSKIDISSEQKTEIISRKFSKYLKKGDIIFLFGKIGVGKTTFIKYLINHLQIKNNLIKTEVPSPTFNILNEYEINGLVIHHYDLFKLKDSNEIKNIGLFENYSSIITFVEWPEIIEKKPKKNTYLLFNYEDDFSKRSLTISSTYKKELIDEFK